jgi:hypothetical protein
VNAIAIDCTPVSLTVERIATIGVASELRRGPIGRMVKRRNSFPFSQRNNRMPQRIPSAA